MSAEQNKKKRIVQDEIGDALTRKKAALGQAPDNGETFHFKLLCPQPLTGIIIGKGGANLTQLTNASKVKIQLSKNDDYFPGTNDRPMLLTGDRTGLQIAVRELVTKIAESPEKRTGGPVDSSTPACNRGPDGSYQTRLLIPREASGVLIGKGGTIIKQMTERSHSKMQLGEEKDMFNTHERIFIINANSVSNLAAGAVEVLNMLLLQPKVREYTNPTSNYSELIQAAAGGVPPPPMQQQFNPQGQQFPGQMAFMQIPAGGGAGMTPGMMMMGPGGMMYPVPAGMYGVPQQSMLPQQQQYQQTYQQPMQQQMPPTGNIGQQQHYDPAREKTPSKTGGRKGGSNAQPQQPAVVNAASAPYDVNPVQQQPYNMGYMGTAMMAPIGQQQPAMGMASSTVPAPASTAPGTGMQMMGQSTAPQQQGMYMQQPMHNMQTGAQMGNNMGMTTLGGAPQQPSQHQQYMVMPAPMANAQNPQQHMQQPSTVGNFQPQQQVPQQAAYNMAYPAAGVGASYMQQPQQQMGGMPMMMPMQQQPMYTQQSATGMLPQQYGSGMYQPAPTGQNNSRGRNGKK